MKQATNCFVMATGFDPPTGGDVNTCATTAAPAQYFSSFDLLCGIFVQKDLRVSRLFFYNLPGGEKVVVIDFVRLRLQRRAAPGRAGPLCSASQLQLPPASLHPPLALYT